MRISKIEVTSHGLTIAASSDGKHESNVDDLQEAEVILDKLLRKILDGCDINSESMLRSIATEGTVGVLISLVPRKNDSGMALKLSQLDIFGE